MKKPVVAILGIFLLASGAAAINIKIEAGVFAGLRTVSDATIKDTYGQGLVFFPYADLEIIKGFALGAGYEFGYSKTAKLGIFEEDATLKVAGFEVFAAFQPRIKKISPYLAVGIGFFSYTQTVESAYARDVDFSKTTFLVAGGIKFYPIKGLYVAAEAKFIPLKVKPFEDEDAVDLGGLRLSLGAGYTFGSK